MPKKDCGCKGGVKATPTSLIVQFDSDEPFATVRVAVDSLFINGQNYFNGKLVPLTYSIIAAVLGVNPSALIFISPAEKEAYLKWSSS